MKGFLTAIIKPAHLAASAAEVDGLTLAKRRGDADRGHNVRATDGEDDDRDARSQAVARFRECELQQQASSASGAPPLAWLGPPPGCSPTANQPSYYCAWHAALNGTYSGPLIHLQDKRVGQLLPPRTVVLLPFSCTASTDGSSLRECLRRLTAVMRANACKPLAVITLHKIFERLDFKLRLIRAHGAVTKIYVPEYSPALWGKIERLSGLPVGLLPYAADDAVFGPFAAATYKFDFGFTGGWQRFDGRYALRSKLFASGGVVDRLRNETGMRFFLPERHKGFLPLPEYVRALSSTKVWLATTERDTLGSRFVEVLASGRAMLFCNRHPVAYAPLGIVEGRHAALFNTTREFEAVLRYYLRHETERLSIVRAARRLALRRHTWRGRAREFVRELPHAACGVQRNLSMCVSG